MTAPAGFSSRPTSRGQVQYVSIQSVDLVNMTAAGHTRQETTVQIDLRYHVGQAHVVPAVGDQWIVRYLGTKWVLDTQLAFNNGAITTVVANPQTGMVQVGSSSPDAGPLYLSGTLINAGAPLVIQATQTPDRPAATSVPTGTHIFDSNLNKPIWSTGAVWVDASGAAV